ncbi:MAG: SBBP repeat-containing protein [Chloroflexi bacterium]|nr:SBBP repeat-containing protein [Chloroflexota bacterium]
MEGFNRRDTVVSYFLGNDPGKWRPNVPVWGGVRYVDLYPGVDLELSGEGGRLAQRFVVRDTAGAGAHSPAVLRNAQLRVEGATRLSLEEDGLLAITTEVGDLRLDLAQVVTAAGSPLPVGEGLGVRSVQGDTLSLPFTLARAAAERVSAAGASDLLYSTFLGGSDTDEGSAIAVDGAGSAYLTGDTYSADFPTTAGVFDPSLNGGTYDAFVVKLTPTGSSLTYATFLGGSSSDGGFGIAVDGVGSAYVTG